MPAPMKSSAPNACRSSTMSLARTNCRLRPSLVLPLRLAARPHPRHSQGRRSVAQFPKPAPAPAPRLATADDNPILNKLLEERAATEEAKKRGRKDDSSAEEEDQPDLGDLYGQSLLHDPISIDQVGESQSTLYGNVVPRRRLAALDPKPIRRRRWERKMVIREVKQRGRVSARVQLMRTERAITVRSPYIRTSMKKLAPLASQIANKTVDDAILQMRYSKKKAAIAVREHLEFARDRAIVDRGMGLGEANGTKGRAATVRLKDGKLHDIKDRTALYVDQAWVGKGPMGFDKNPRARGRIDKLRLRQTSVSVLLKEEATRVREHHERKDRERRRKPWLHLPDRPIVAQRPYYTW